VRLDNIYPPDLTAQPELARHFRVYDDAAQGQSRDGEKEYTFTLRPVVGGTIELPPIRISYFDTQQREYRTVATQPIPVRVREVTRIGGNMVIETVAERSASAAPAAGGLAPAPIDMDPSGMERRPFGLRAWQAGVALCGPACFTLVLGARAAAAWAVRRRRARRGRNVYRRARHALHGFLRAAAGAARAEGALWPALRDYFADRLALHAAGLTPGDIQRGLLERGVAPASVRALATFLDGCFNAEFAGGAAQDAAWVDEGRSVMDILADVENTLRPRKRCRPAVVPLAAMLGLGLGAGGAAAAVDLPAERWFLWDAANAQMGRAAAPEDFRRAADMYERLVNAGARNGAVFHNLGTAWLMAERYDEAVSALLRAERHAGSNAAIRRNLLIALRKRAGDNGLSLPWYRPFLAWHYGLAFSVRLTIACAAFALLWIAWLLRRLGMRRLARPLLTLALTILVAAGSSAFASWHQETRETGAFRAAGIAEAPAAPARSTDASAAKGGAQP
jgi:hypothetical protein